MLATAPPWGLAPPPRRNSLRVDPGDTPDSPPVPLLDPRGHTLMEPREDPVHSSPHPLTPMAVTSPILWAWASKQGESQHVRLSQ